jgi:hypothetical protein
MVVIVTSFGLDTSAVSATNQFVAAIESLS